jgi:multidrug efflux pump subunit AcrA (membrane-fusion protein)
MKHMEVKKRGWVKTAAIVFLAVMLVLTFFSNTIMNRSLPEVATQYASSGTITARIRGNGTVAANENFEVKTERTRNVLEVPVRVGDFVNIGDVLIVFALNDVSDELQIARDALHEMELRLERMLLEMSRPDGSLDNSRRAIQQARSELTEAQRARDRIPYSNTALNQAQDALNSAQRRLTRAQNTLNEAQTGLIGPQIALNAAIAILSEREGDVNEEWNRLTQLLHMYPPADPEIIEAARQALADAEIARDAARESVNAARAVYDAANEPVESAQLAVSVAQAAVDQSQMQLSTQEGYRNDWINADNYVRQCQQNLDRLIADLALAQDGADIDNSLEAINLRELRREIQEKQDEIAELEKGDDSSELTSLVAGIITTRPISPGDQAFAGDVLMTIENIDRGYSLSFEVTADQARRVGVGDQAEVDNRWWWGAEEIRATLVAIRNDPQNPATGRILVFSVTGAEGGEQLSLVLNQRSENYNIIVPNTAVRSDSNGDFVLLLESRSSPLGNRYVAQRVDVNILARDDTHTAVSGGLSSWGDFVITHSSRPINPGDQVRLTDNP